MPGGRRPLDPVNGGVTEDWGQVILRIKEDLVSASAPSPRVQMQARCVYVVPAPALTDHPCPSPVAVETNCLDPQCAPVMAGTAGVLVGLRLLLRDRSSHAIHTD